MSLSSTLFWRKHILFVYLLEILDAFWCRVRICLKVWFHALQHAVMSMKKKNSQECPINMLCYGCLRIYVLEWIIDIKSFLKPVPAIWQQSGCTTCHNNLNGYKKVTLKNGGNGD